MDTNYNILIGFLIYTVIYIITEDNCSIQEYFQNNKNIYNEHTSHYINQCLMIFLVIILIIYIYRIIFIDSIIEFFTIVCLK